MTLLRWASSWVQTERLTEMIELQTTDRQDTPTTEKERKSDHPWIRQGIEKKAVLTPAFGKEREKLNNGSSHFAA